MTFLNASLLLGLVAAAIPVVVHLISRREPRRIVFPATRFIQQRLEANRSRLKIRRWWLLAMRILALVALAFALARPMIAASIAPGWLAAGLLAALGVSLLAIAGRAGLQHQQRTLSRILAVAAVASLIAAMVAAGVSSARGPEVVSREDTPVALAIVLDNSVRTGRQAPPDEANAGANTAAAQERVMDRIREHADWVIGRYPRDSRIAILDRSPRPATFSLDVAGAKRQIERAEPLGLTRPLSERVEAAIRLVRSSDLPRKLVLVITDLTVPSFPAAEWETGSVAALLEQVPPLRLQILDVGSAPKGNLRLGLPEIADASPPRQTPTAISIEIDSATAFASPDEPDPRSSDGPAAPRSAIIELQLHATGSAAAGLPIVRDSELVLPPLRGVDRTTVTLGSGSTRVLLSVPPLEIGTHHGVIQILDEDELPIDNRRYFTLDVRPAASLLLVASDRESAEWIGAALTAPRPPNDPLAEYQVEISEWLPSDRQAYLSYDAILLIDPSPPSPATQSDLQAYLQAGGKLLSLLGPAIADATSGDGLASERITSDEGPEQALLTGLIRRWRPSPPGTFLEIDRPSHPAVASLASVAGGVPWGAFRINQYWQLEPIAARDIVVIRYAGTDHPALIDRGGNHLIFTTPMPALVGPARGWNDLFTGSDAWPAFLLIRELVQSLVEQDRGLRNLLVADLPSLRIASNESTQESLTSPDSQQTERDPAEPPVADRSEPEPATLEQVFQLFPPGGPVTPLRARDSWLTIGNVDRPGTYWIRGAGVQTGFSVNLRPGETELTRLDPSRLDDWLGVDRYDLFSDRQSLGRAEGNDQPTQSLYGWWLLLLCGAMVIEQIIANRFYRGSHPGRGPRIEGVR